MPPQIKQRRREAASELPASEITRDIGIFSVAEHTVWPDEYTGRIAARLPCQPDPRVDERHLLGLAQIIAVPDAFSPSERRRAETLAVDGRIQVALDVPDAGFTQVLAAGPELVNWWVNAPDAYCNAVITAALDARRVGIRAPLSRTLLAVAAPGYLTSAQQATAAPDWLQHSLAYATTPLRGAAATLCPVAADMGVTAGYTVADYLHQHARRVSRTTPVPETAWRALVDHHHPDDTITLADSAQRRGQDQHAETLYRQAADAGNEYAAYRLASLVADQGRLDEAIAVLGAHADTGNESAAHRLVDLLATRGRLDDAIAVLSVHPDTGRWYAAQRLAGLLAARGRLDELRARADTGDESAAWQLAGLLAAQDRFDDALTILRARADTGDESAAWHLAGLLARHSHLDELRARADTGDESAAWHLAGLLARQGRLDELRAARADVGDGTAAERLADLLTKQGRLDDALTILRARADTGDATAAERLQRLNGQG